MLRICNVQCDALNAKWYIIMTTFIWHLFKFQSAAGRTRCITSGTRGLTATVCKTTHFNCSDYLWLGLYVADMLNVFLSCLTLVNVLLNCVRTTGICHKQFSFVVACHLIGRVDLHEYRPLVHFP
jgi:hypothetical protein